jgi:GTPase SAR1 family protein
MLVGQGRAGKTALVRNMMGEKFVPTPSTVGIKKFERRIIQGNLNATRLEEFKESRLKEMQYFVSRDANLRQNHTAPSDEKEKSLLLNEIISKSGAFSTGKKKCSKESVPPALVSRIKPGEEDEMTLQISRRSGLFDDSNTKLCVTLNDFGGQDVFNVIHQFFIFKHAIYLVVFDQQLFLTDQESCLKGLKFWVNSVIMHTGFKGSTAPAAVVGTRADLVKDRGNISGEISSMFSNKFTGLSLITNKVPNKRTPLPFFSVDNTNTTEGSELQRLLENLLAFAKRSAFANSEIPLVWVKALDKMKSLAVSFLYYRDVLEIATVYNMQLKDLPDFLAFFTQAGAILWIDDSRLRDVVIIDPLEYFVKPVTTVICKHIATMDDPSRTVHFDEIHAKCRKDLSIDWLKMLEMGLLSHRLVTTLVGSATSDVNNVLFLMKKYHLLIPLSFAGSDSDSSSLYFAPALLPGCPYNLCCDPEDFEYQKLISRLKARRTMVVSTFRLSVSFYFAFFHSAVTFNTVPFDICQIKKKCLLPNCFFYNVLA